MNSGKLEGSDKCDLKQKPDLNVSRSKKIFVPPLQGLPNALMTTGDKNLTYT